MQRKLIILNTLFLGFISLSSAYAGVKIEESLTTLSSMQKMAQITMVNDGDSKAYVQMEATEVVCQNADKITCKNSQERKTDASAMLTFSNPKFILRPQQKKIIYVIWRGQLPEHNKMFLITGRDMADKTEKTIQADDGKNHKVGLKIITLYKSRVLVAQANGRFEKPTATQKDQTTTITNIGSAPARVKISQICEDQSVCKAIPLNQRHHTTIAFLGAKEHITTTQQAAFTNQLQYYDFITSTWKPLEISDKQVQ